MNDESCAAIAKAIAHPTRLAILRILLHEPGCVCGHIVSVLGQPQSTVSQHLRCMKSAGLIKGTVDGPRVCYCLDRDAWQVFRDHLKLMEQST